MDRKKRVAIIEREKIVFVTRLADHTKTQLVLKSLIDGGAKVMEITSNTPNFANEISKGRIAFPNVLIGAGTVTNKIIAKAAIEAGAHFLVTPNTNIELIEIAHNHNIPILMGALTPTEVCVAWQAGADFVKLFPADIMGIPYFTSIKAPLNNVKLLAVGGIELNSVSTWMSSGAHGIGIASVLSESISDQNDLDAIKKNAEAFINEMKKLSE